MINSIVKLNQMFSFKIVTKPKINDIAFSNTRVFSHLLHAVLQLNHFPPQTFSFFLSKMADYSPAKKSTDQSVRLLFLTEGLSAKSYIDGCKSAAGGQDHIGVLACNVGVSNPRGCSQSSNKLLHRLATIMGLQFNKHYTTPAALAKLKYSMIVLSGDGDVDGWNFNGHLLNAIHFYWPELVEKGRVAIFRPTQSLCKTKKQNND